ncbi:motile sperm domain-containing protein 2-like [Oppia nitens]|uniref:motile sperm domain-containing protein 2-like n=1 Tax=Oppia nitens TaxID=1686743 RepID=UPI0023DC3697|nr:motile sperm domain-containing protein 2-like [Oppia nitens]
MAFATLNSYEVSQKIADSLISELRQKFLELVAKNPELYYDKDIEKIKSKNWSIQRFLNHHKSNVDKALDGLDSAMKWRKSFGVLELSEKDFPREVFQSAPLFLYGKDLNGAQLMIMRGKVTRKIKSWIPMAQKFFIYLIEKADLADSGKGVTLLLDCKESGIKNADIDFMKFAHHIFNDYYPGLVNAGLVYKLPTVMEAVFKVVKSWLNEEQEKFCYMISKKTINEYVSANELPDFLLGTNAEPYRNVPDGSPTAHELAERLGIKTEKADKLVKHLEQFYTI